MEELEEGRSPNVVQENDPQQLDESLSDQQTGSESDGSGWSVSENEPVESEPLREPSESEESEPPREPSESGESEIEEPEFQESDEFRRPEEPEKSEDLEGMRRSEKTEESKTNLAATKELQRRLQEVDELKKDLNEMTQVKRDLETKLLVMKKRFEEELSSFDELRIEHIFKNSGAKKYFDDLRESIRDKNEMISTLRTDLESTRKEVVTWKEKFKEKEKECSVYWKACQDAQLVNVKLEAENKALHERSLQSRSLIMSPSTSNLLENQVPPPPPLDIPPVDEIIGKIPN